MTWDKSFEEHFYKFIKQINDAVFDNQKGNISFCKDIFELDVIADLIYIDTPYIPQKGSITTYREFYHFLEGLTMYENWNSKIDYNSKHRRLLPKYSRGDCGYLTLLSKVFWLYLIEVMEFQQLKKFLNS